MDSRAERVERHRLVAGFIETVLLNCVKCKKDIEFDYVERQLSNYKTEELRTLMKSKKKLGLFCCYCYNLADPTRYSTTMVWTTRDVRVMIDDRELQNISAVNVHTNGSHPTSRTTIDIDLIASDQTENLLGKIMNLQIAGQNYGRYMIGIKDVQAVSDDFIRLRVQGHLITS